MLRTLFFLLPLLGSLILSATVSANTFRKQQLAADLTVGYATTLVDVNRDGHTDIVVVDADRVIWFENPHWTRHTIIEGQTARDNVCIAAHDIDHDGRVDFALGADWRPFDTMKGGTIQWLRQPDSLATAWEVRHIATEPTTHRMRWIDINADNHPELIVVPLMGRGSTKPHWNETGVRVLSFTIPADPFTERWPVEVLDDSMRVTHNFAPTDFNRDGQSELLFTSAMGIHLLSRSPAGSWSNQLLAAGNQDSPPNRGASEIKQGRFADGTDYIATIEPWHGDEVVVYTHPNSKSPSEALWTRQVLDHELKWGHAVWCTNLDTDPDEELIIGVRDHRDDTWRSGVRIYDLQGGAWRRTLVDPGGVAVEDLAAADLDRDGRTDIVAVGRATRNVVIYWNE